MPASPTASSLNGNTCGNICGVIRAQTEECDLTALDLEDLPRQINVDSAYRGNVLLNRTAAECMCSMPVLRRFRGCRKCIESDRDAGSLDIVDFYQEECNELGYWSDDAVVEPEAIEEDDGEADVSDESPTDGVGMAMYISTGALAVSISAMCVLSGGLL
ncbi:hypothetical protein BJX63DRAFT_397990 [Aspergillus granulosus]|uniref:Uncharacterized protein n=1 Tax=Aspergillus granulosus TaxID=176169 RepID=A0ABR4H8U0_9EURO